MGARNELTFFRRDWTVPHIGPLGLDFQVRMAGRIVRHPQSVFPTLIEGIEPDDTVAFEHGDVIGEQTGDASIQLEAAGNDKDAAANVKPVAKLTLALGRG